MWWCPSLLKMAQKQVGSPHVLIVLQCSVTLILIQNAAMPEDYISPADFNVTFAADDLMGDATQCAMISTTDDNVLEGDHDFTVMLGRATPDVVTIDTPSSATATLVDNDSMHIFACIVVWNHLHYAH